jgi:hypothetical protein
MGDGLNGSEILRLRERLARGLSESLSKLKRSHRAKPAPVLMTA